MKTIGELFPDSGERLDGPAVIAFWGAEQPGDGNAMGLREIGWHSHRRAQLFSVESGLVRIRTAEGSWILPPHRVGWVPAGIMHDVSISGPLSGWGAMLVPGVCEMLPQQACVMAASELLRALVRKAMMFADATELTPVQERLTAVLIDEIRAAPLEALHLPMPSDARLERLAMYLLANPADDRPFARLAADASLSERTGRRLFLAQTGMTFLQWRQQARLTRAFELLAQGRSVAAISDELGYATPSNFIAMFRRAFGVSPARYFSRMEGSRTELQLMTGSGRAVYEQGKICDAD